MTLYHRPTREWTMETGYTKLYKDLLYDTPTSLDYKLIIDTYKIDSKYRAWTFWTIRLFSSLERTIDLLQSENRETHLFTPGLGLGFKNQEWNISYDYSKTESTRGENILYHTHTTILQYDYSQYIHASFSKIQVISERPRYITSELLIKLSATF